MISFALLTGIYAYGIFFLGVGKVLTSSAISVLTFLYIFSLAGIFLKEWKNHLFSFTGFDKKSLFIVCILFLFLVINGIGALGPEYAFDALWYHLSLPKLYLSNHAIYHIPGGLFYYSDMPKLGEMLFIVAVSLHTEILANFTQMVFGVLICFLLFQFSKKYYSLFVSLLVVLIFYANLVVSWESTVAYIDLIRTFYEFFALLLFLQWVEVRKDRYLYLSSTMLGLAITTKLLALGSLFMVSAILFYLVFKQTGRLRTTVVKTTLFTILALCIPSPWFIFSFLHTGNPVYPFFTPIYPTQASWSLLNPIQFFNDIFMIFTHAADPVLPIYIIMLPLLVFIRKSRKEIKILAVYCLGVLLIWYITPRTGGGRFILPYLPAFSLLFGELVSLLAKKKIYHRYRTVLIYTVIILALSSLCYRSIAVSKYLPYLLGKESKQSFLLKHLNFSFGDFLDVDGKIAKQIKPTDVVLLIGFHNLYYVDFPFVDSSSIQKGDRFTYVATQHTKLPKEFSHAKKVYEEGRTGVILYYVGEKRWGK